MKSYFRSESLERFIWWAGAAALLVPALFTPWFLYPYIFGRALFFQVLVEAMSVAWILLLIRRPERYRPRLHPFALALAIFAGLALVSALLGVDPGRSFWGGQARMTGWFTLAHAGLYFVIMSSVITAERDWRRLFIFGSLSMALITAIAFVERFPPAFRSSIAGGVRVASLVGNPIFLAAVLLFGIGFAVWLAATSAGRHRWIWIGLTLAETIALFFTETRGALVAFSVTVVAVTVGTAVFSKSKKARRTAAAATVILALVALLMFITRDNPFWRQAPPIWKLTHLSINLDTSATRIVSWQIALEGIRARPLLGWGSENFNVVFDRYYRPELLRYGFYETVSDKPHNVLLETAVATGVPGLAAYLAAFAILLVALIRGYRSGRIDGATAAIGCGLILAYQIQNFFELETPNALVLLAATLAWLSARLRPLPVSSRVSGEVTRVPTAALAVLFIIFIPFAYYGNIAPLAGNWEAGQSENVAGRDPLLWKDPALAALAAGGPYRRELRVVITRDFLNWEGSGRLPGNVVRDVVDSLISEMKKSAAASSATFQERFMLAQLLVIRGGYFEDAQSYTDAETQLTLAAELSPGRQAVPFLLGKLYIMTDRPDEAVRVLREALVSDPTAAEAHWFLGLGLIATDHRAEGVGELEESLRLGRTLVKANELQYLIDLYLEDQKFEPVVPLYEKMILNDPDNADLHAKLATVYARLGKAELAIFEAQRSAELDPGYAEAARAFVDSLR